MSQRSIYLDYAATTPTDPAVVEAMAECMQRDGYFANASSVHRFGRAAARKVAEARARVAQRIGVEPDTLVFTSGATEADNIALQGVMLAHGEAGSRLITARTEHKAVLDTAAALGQRGYRIDYVDCDADGLIDPDALDTLIDASTTTLVSIMHVNNETGVVQDIRALGEVCRSHGVLFHVDAAQSVGKLELDVARLPVDLMSLTAHKVYGPKGIGALYLRPDVTLAGITFGGEQERGLRPGTLPTPLIVGMGRAYELADPAIEGPRVRELRDRLWTRLAGLESVRCNGHFERSAPHVLNVAFAGVSGESLRLAIDEIAVSAGSACNADAPESSHVLSAMGLGDALAESSLRFSLGRYTTAEEVDYAAGRVAEAVERLRRLAVGAPRWCRA